MKIIAHRANLHGPNPSSENTPVSIHNCLELGFDVEVDVWYVNGKLFLGHNAPQYYLENIQILKDPSVWVHTKNLECLYFLKDSCHCFIHNTDEATITTKGFVWVYPGKLLHKNSVAVMSEFSNYSIESIRDCYAICTDYPLTYRERLND